jgi:hypothetical protein
MNDNGAHDLESLRKALYNQFKESCYRCARGDSISIGTIASAIVDVERELREREAVDSGKKAAFPVSKP